MGYAPDATIARFRGSYNLGVFFRLGIAPNPILISLSVNDILASIPNLDPAGSKYIGAGRLLSIPQLETLINGIASTVSFSLAGLDVQGTQLMLDSAPPVLGAPVTVAIATMDVRYQPETAPIPLWSGVGDFIAETIAIQTDVKKNRTQTLTLSAISGDQSRQLGNNLTYTDATQQMLFPGDTFCQRTPAYYDAYQVVWPRFS